MTEYAFSAFPYSPFSKLMADPDNKSIFRHISFYIALSTTAVLHLLLTFVVILFVLSTANIINNRFLHFEKLDYFEIFITAVILIISLLVFLKSIKKISKVIKQTIFKRN
jgi:hypothetical protein